MPHLRFLSVFTLFFILLIPATLRAQWYPDRLRTSPQISEADSSKLYLSVDAVGFFKNNEYFNPIAKGATLPGTEFIPKIGYQFSDKLRAELGAVGLYYSGDQQKKGTTYINSIFARVQYAITPKMNVVLGNLYGGVNHRLIEPLYQWERHYTQRPESGLQFLYDDGKRYFADVWVNWERFIEHGDTVPEVLTFGASARAVISSPQSELKVSVPLQLLIYHQGGQIDQSKERMIVAGNLATGITAETTFGRSNFIRKATFSFYVAGYYDKLPDKSLRPYDSGFGIYPVMRLDAKRFSFMMGYWYARHFYAFQGEPLFSSFNLLYPGKTLPKRSLLTTKLAYSYPVRKEVSLGAHIEAYTDMNAGRVDYSMGVYLRLNGNFTLARTKIK
ncbi:MULTISPECIES: hypothetical protein [unclassified Dysgonomonas]|uniref:hypothetical protein n=1 Tax=unclassified Dysgonomonas TaxID=2630389 RepID=UPI0024737744|nr:MULTISPECIES: hypothetical protein [unclassified Dysgonomonas]